MLVAAVQQEVDWTVMNEDKSKNGLLPAEKGVPFY